MLLQATQFSRLLLGGYFYKYHNIVDGNLMYRNSIVPDPLRTGNRILGFGSYGLYLYHELSAIGHLGTSGA